MEGTYGPTSNSSSVSIIQVPSISVNSTGHIIDIGNKNLQIRDYVQQNQPLDQNGERPILTSYSANKNDETAPVVKAGGLSYNEASGTLAVKGGVIAGGPSTITGDLTVESGYIIGKVKGDVEGQAVPKVHAALANMVVLLLNYMVMLFLQMSLLVLNQNLQVVMKTQLKQIQQQQLLLL